MPLCSVCKKRQAVVFATDSAHPGRTAGYCFTCARKIGLPNLENMIKQFGFNADMIEEVEEQMAQAAENGELPFSAMFDEVMPGLEDGDDYDDYDDEEDGDESDEDYPDDAEEEHEIVPIGTITDGGFSPIMPEQGGTPAKAENTDVSPNADDNENDDEQGCLFNPFRDLFGSSFEMGGAQFADGRQKKRKRARKDAKGRFLGEYCEDLTKKAHEGKIDVIIGRDREINRVIQILCRKSKNNPCLIGEPGVGKTAIAEGLALRHQD